MPTVSETSVELTKALAEAKTAHDALDKARSTLAPLESTAKEADQKVTTLMKQYQSLTMDAPEWVGKKKGRRSKGTYNISNESKIARVGKAAYSRTITAGGSEKDAKTAQKQAEKNLAAKIGVTA